MQTIELRLQIMKQLSLGYR